MTPATKRSPRTVAGTDTAACLALGLVVPFTVVQGQAGATTLIALTDAELVWDTRALDVPEARRIVEQSPKLAALVDRVIDRAGRYSVNLRLIALLADESDMLGDLGVLDAATANERLDHFIGALSHMFETGRSQQDGGQRTRVPALALAGQSFGARAVATFLAGDADARKLSARWRARFGPAPQVVKDVESEKAAPASSCACLGWWVRQAGASTVCTLRRAVATRRHAHRRNRRLTFLVAGRYGAPARPTHQCMRRMAARSPSFVPQRAGDQRQRLGDQLLPP